MDEADRLKRKVEVPDPDAWDKQMCKIRVLDQLVYDSDPNLTTSSSRTIGRFGELISLEHSDSTRT
jgi:hypothetical protein